MSARKPRVGDCVLYMTANGLRPAVLARTPGPDGLGDVIIFVCPGDAPLPPFGGPEVAGMVKYHPGAKRDGRQLYTWAYPSEVL
ncbi:MAG: hypothetical protein M1325_04455 [Actinobacteria bacterium]|nr:hypothetical protein [Actinomycetota bacterium]